jgi:ATP-dependent DNA helicase RecQ
VRLLAYFGEQYGTGGDRDSAHPELAAAAAHLAPRYTCGSCDNCIQPPKTWDGTDAARKLLSTIYRAHEASDLTFGASHIIDIVRGKDTDKMRQFGHDKLSTFGLGNMYSETQLRGVLRQLLAVGALSTEKVFTDAGYSFETLVLCDGSRAVLRGERAVELRESSAAKTSRSRTRSTKPAAAAQNLGPDAQVRFINLKAWRTEVAKEHNLPAYVVFADATLAGIAERNPQTLDDLHGVSGIGVKKLEAYGEAVLKVVRAS